MNNFKSALVFIFFKFKTRHQLINRRTSNLNDLTPMIFSMKLTHLGSEASNYIAKIHHTSSENNLNQTFLYTLYRLYWIM